jgi:uncharacterized protein
MADYYFDSSGLAKRYVNEQGSIWVREIVSPGRHHAVYTARISGAEIVTALALRGRSSTLAPAHVRAAITRFRQVCRRGYALIDASAPVVDLAMSLAEQHGLRGYDAIQLATALSLRAALPARRRPALTFVSADGGLNVAATSVGLSVVDPTSYR